MAFDVASLLCPFITTSNIFTLKDTTKQYCDNARLNVPDNASLAVYQVALAGHWLVLGLKTDNSPIDVRLSKMEAAIENIVFLAVVSNLAINQLMEREAAMAITTALSKGCVCRGAQMDHGDGQECAPSGQPGCGDPGRCAQTGGTYASSTFASRASRPRRVRPRKSYCSSSTHNCCKAK